MSALALIQQISLFVSATDVDSAKRCATVLADVLYDVVARMCQPSSKTRHTAPHSEVYCGVTTVVLGGSVAEWLACWTQAQKGPGSNRSRDAVG